MRRKRLLAFEWVISMIASMAGLSMLVLGLGLFFLGIQLVGENLRRLSGGTFRAVIQKMGGSPVLGALTGTAFGALMQSATAVTFILAGMRKSGLVTALAAAPVILWCNVGLTALAFAATFNIHPAVAYLVGLAGILFGMVREATWRSAAGVLLGVGLILFGLESMGEGAAPLRDEAWFQHLLNTTVGSPALGFGIGILCAAVLQSNTGAAMLIITLASVGTFDLQNATMLIYGTNLGAIGLRVVLSLNLDRVSQQLVRFEDVFCVWSGLVMVGLALLEGLGIPLIRSLVETVAPDQIGLQLALVFLLSNLIPAILLWPAVPSIMRGLAKLLPPELSESLGQPKFLSSSALDDPGTAADLASREIQRLLRAVRPEPVPAPDAQDRDAVVPAGFAELAAKIETYLAKLAAMNKLSQRNAREVHVLRSELGLVRYLAEAMGEFNVALNESASDPNAKPQTTAYQTKLESLTHLAVDAVESRSPDKVESLRILAKTAPDELRVDANPSPARPLATTEDAFELTCWMLHRLAKVLQRL